MDITPIYELRSRLRGAAIAGTRIISEDFRLKKAAEAFSGLSGASPVFNKLNEIVKKLLSGSDNAENLSETLIDALTLADAVIVTLGTTNACGDFEAVSGAEGSAAVNAPYSRLSPILDELTGHSKGGGYTNFIDTVRNQRELLNDYRVKAALVKALGASYAALAAEARNVLSEMGEEIIPLLKNGFDNKGKKEFAHRVEVMENIAGAKENDFYLEQLETAENDARKALIAALRFNKNNFEKLTELVKTEKGDAKKTALKAILYMDDEKAYEFLREYSGKKPSEVLELLAHVSSNMTSKLAVEIIDRCLTDKDGNKISLSNATTAEQVKSPIKIKASWTNLHNALSGKFGAEIEALYRDFHTEDENIAAAMDRSLGRSISVSNDEGLKRLALELNGKKSKMRGQYVYSEATVRLSDSNNTFSDKDNAKWFDFGIGSLSPKPQTSDRILQAVSNLVLKESGKYALMFDTQDAMGKWAHSERPVKKAAAEAVIEAMLKHYDIRPDYFARCLQAIIDPEDPKMCKTAGEFFLKRADAPYKQNSFTPAVTMNLVILGRCGYKNIKGLAVRFCKNNPYIENWRLTGYIQNLPGDREYKLSEAREIVKLARSGKLKFDRLNIDTFEQWTEKEFM